MVLAAGRGERMRPLSLVFPKPALPLPDGPVIASALRLAAGAGFETIVVNTWHLGDSMSAAALAVEVGGAAIALSPEPKLMGTAGGLALARERGLLGDDGPVLVINGDGLLDLDLEPLFERHLMSNDSVTVALLPHRDPTLWSRVLLDPSGLVSQILPSGRPGPGELPFLYPGVMAISRDAIESLPVTAGQTPERLWWPAMAEKRLGGIVVPGNWREVGTPENYRVACVAQCGDGSVIDASASAAPSAVVKNSFIGRDAVLGIDTVVESSVVAEGAVVEAGARIDRSVLLGSVSATAGEELDGEFRGLSS